MLSGFFKKKTKTNIIRHECNELPSNLFPLKSVKNEICMFSSYGHDCILDIIYTIILGKEPVILGEMNDKRKKYLLDFLSSRDVISIKTTKPEPDGAYDIFILLKNGDLYFQKNGDLYFQDHSLCSWTKMQRVVTFDKKIVDIVCGWSNFVLTSDGEVRGFSYYERERECRNAYNNKFENKRIIQIRAEYKYFLVMAEDYSIYIWRCNDDVHCIKNPGKNIIDAGVACNDRLFLTKYGDLIYGNKTKKCPNNNDPISSLHFFPPKTSVVGAITKSSKILFFNKDHDERMIFKKTKVIRFFAQKKIKITQIFCCNGKYSPRKPLSFNISTICVDDKGYLYGLGDNTYGQLLDVKEGNFSEITSLPYTLLPKEVGQFREKLFGNGKYLDTEIKMVL